MLRFKDWLMAGGRLMLRSKYLLSRICIKELIGCFGKTLGLRGECLSCAAIGQFQYLEGGRMLWGGGECLLPPFE